MSDEHFMLLDGQFIERKFQFFNQHAADIERFRPGVGRWQKIFDPQHLAVFIPDSRVTEGLWPLLAEKVRDAIARDPKKPASHVVNRHQQAISFYQFVKD